MSPISVAILIVVMAAACADSMPSSLPTAPTANEPAGTAAAPVRTEQWQLTMTIRDVLGANCDDPALSATLVVDLQMTFAGDGTVAMRYGNMLRRSPSPSELTGWTLEGGFEGSGLVYEGLPCSGRQLEPSGAPTTLTGYFSDDGNGFTGIEVRRYLGRPEGDIVYHVEWSATRVDSDGVQS